MKRLFDGHNEQVYGCRRYSRFIINIFFELRPHSARFVPQKSKHFVSTRQAIKILEANSCYFYEILRKICSSWLFISQKGIPLYCWQNLANLGAYCSIRLVFLHKSWSQTLKRVWSTFCSHLWHRNVTRCPQTSFSISNTSKIDELTPVLTKPESSTSGERSIFVRHIRSSIYPQINDFPRRPCHVPFFQTRPKLIDNR